MFCATQKYLTSSEVKRLPSASILIREGTMAFGKIGRNSLGDKKLKHAYYTPVQRKGAG